MSVVAIGDSLTQGFQHGAIRRAGGSYPAMVARALGHTGPGAFAVPDFTGGGLGGPVLDLELLLRELDQHATNGAGELQLRRAVPRTLRYMDQREDYWERGEGAGPSGTGPVHHNLAVWGFTLCEALSLHDSACERAIPASRDHAVSQVIEAAMYRTARRVLNPQRREEQREETQLTLASRAAPGGISDLIFALGSNHALSSCVALAIRWSEDADLQRMPHERSCTLWRPAHFRALYSRCEAQLQQLKATRVFVATVPYATVAPIVRGVSPGSGRPDGDGYFDYYSNFWIWDRDFDPATHKHLTREQARTINQTIDEYNQHIRATAARNGWHVLDWNDLLNQLSFRAALGRPTYAFPAGLREALAKNPRTAFRVRPTGELLLDTRYLRIPARPLSAQASAREWQHAYQGGIIGLDGIHPTTIGYGVVAHEVLRVMQQAGTPNADPNALDWDSIVEMDTLLCDIPRVLASLEQLLGFLFGHAKLLGILQHITGR